ncbi:fimbrial biogenesis chaperone [Escherichia coli]|uniref:fimbrial biogenesis chaperone n=1 Tax=Escherichia coli TaxID=562 RepID=UPI000B42CF55|nr:molecular chaperone [Escherichia coli]EFJ7371580.1 molecular chaperone [Escherichia coli]OWC41998.1 Cro/Cl family transcriptional regulator [Escherichia coli]RCP65675.1 molecular chaperone [Escherichia coli]CAD5789291.1 CS12 fimbria chaperone FasB-like protein [Escherichia coli]CAD5791001.1 CS12 fimbria chaperone FasB-like protein [Escherichia coli]
MKIRNIAFIASCFYSQLLLASELFGPHESKIIFDGGRQSVNYSIDNTGKTPWLVQAWVENTEEKRTDKFISVPTLFRVEPSSQFSVRVSKNGDLPEDKETIFWLVSNSLPGGEKGEDKELKGDEINAKLNLAFRFKVPMIYRPASLKSVKQQPDALQWSQRNNDELIVHNPTKHVIHLNYIIVNGQRKQGEGISLMVAPDQSVKVNTNANKGSQIKFGVINDYGAIKEYMGVIK